MDESGTGGAECWNVVGGKNCRCYQISGECEEFARVLHEVFLVHVLLYGRRRRDLGLGLCRWKTLRGLLGIGRMD